MSGTRSPLLGDWFQPPADPQANVLLRQMPLAPRPSYADAADQTWAAIQAKLEEQQRISQERGLWTGGSIWEGGHPTVKGVADAAQQVAGNFEGGIKAFHGSPHSFERFDPSKIGTGEGAQAYGHGLYFAENEGVARSYKDAGPSSSAAFDAINQRLSQLAKVMEKDAVPGAYRKFRTSEGSAAASEYDALMQKKAEGLGHMYEVDINADPERMLHWDKPLNEQHPDVLAKMRPLLKDWYAYNAAATGASQEQLEKMLTGRLAYEQLSHPSTNMNVTLPYRQAAASEAMREAGIPGIRYLDQNSRAAGEGTHNVVVFDADTINLLRKYGIAGLGVGLGATATQGGE